MSLFDIDIPKDLQDEMDAAASKASTQSKGSNAKIYKEYGGFNKFLLTYGLKMSNPDDVEEGKAIATEMRLADEQEAREAREAKRQQRTQAQQHTPQRSTQAQQHSEWQQLTPQQRTPRQHSQLQGPLLQQHPRPTRP